MRSARLFLAALCALLPLPALADVTAHYVSGKQAVTVEVDEGGNSRFDVAGKFAIIRRGTTDYLVVYDKGQPHVTELGEMMTLFQDMMKTGPDAAPPNIAFTLTGGAPAAVAGRQGTVWSLGMTADSPDAKDRSVEMVMSADPALAQVGDVFRRLIGSGTSLIEVMIPHSSGFSARVAEAFAKGTPLRITAAPGPVEASGTLIEFHSLDTKEIDPKRFELPAPPVSATEMMGLIGPSADAAPSGEVDDLP